MNAEQKQRIAHEISNWRNARNDHSSQITGDRMAALLQELVDAPEPEPVRWLIYHNEFLRAETSTKNEANGYQKQGFRVAPLYAAPPAPSVHVSPMENIALNEWLDKTEWVQKELNTFPVSSLGMHRADVMRLEIERLRKLLAAPTPAEAPADVARDAELLDWLEQEANDSRTGVSIVYRNQADDESGIRRGYRLMRYHQIFSAHSNLRAAIDAAMSEKGGA